MSVTMGRPESIWSRVWLRASAIFWFLLVVGFLLSLPVIIDVSWEVLIAVALVAALLAIVAAWLTRLMFRKERLRRPIVSYFKAWVGMVFIVSIIAATPVYALALFTELRPLTVPKATLSNGTRTVVFQGMMHIGSEPFYKGVVYDLEEALTKDYVLYYEGVQPSPDGDQWFADTLAGGGDLSDNYQKVAGLCGLTFQLDYFQLLVPDMTARPDRHVQADVTAADMMHEYERLVADDPAFAAAIEAQKSSEGVKSGGADGMSQVLAVIDGGTPAQQSLAGTICRGGLSWLLGRASEPAPMDPVILDFRNRALAGRIIADTHPQIYVTYGAEHLKGVLALLQANDPAWEIKSLSWTRVIDTPEQLTGRL